MAIAERVETIPMFHPNSLQSVQLTSAGVQELPQWLQENYRQGEAETSVVITHWGDITVVSSPMGKRRSNEQLFQEFENRGIDNLERAQLTVAATGIKMRHSSPALSETYTQKDVIAGAAQISGLLLKMGMQETNLIPQYVIGTNLNLPSRFTREIANAAGLDPATPTEAIRTACAGWEIALLKALLDPKIKGKVVAIVSSEPSGHLQDPLHYSKYENVGIVGTFTDLHTVTIIDTSKYIVLAHRIQIIKGGGIDVAISYDDSLVANDGAPDYFNIVPGPDNDILVFNDEGIFLKIDKPKNGMTSTMDGFSTTRHFRDYTPPFIYDFLVEDYGVLLVPTRKETEEGKWIDTFELVGYDVDFLACHQPGERVPIQINRGLDRLLGKQTPVRLTFDLPDIGTGNGTSAVQSVALQYGIETQNPDPNVKTGLLTMGIGSVFVAAVIQRVA